MKYPKLRELKEAIKSLFSKPYTTKFPFEPHEGFDGFRGKPKYFEEYCVGCGACSEVCPGLAITVIDPIPVYSVVIVRRIVSRKKVFN